ncbi:WecB/TagA/CpsF family glycosyltransferase [Kushneria indalinina]|uniref:N-acetylglucosaminyldiphosphoundecaprenol N-acetyl-beta-D-mannosaminyltransferase n=1 Tax=Kushneria indalinina DSM 14324 TaxID=1122140 RepID=A0A3D9DV72_9GAMM|nr:WecB/TagA/CpsF family glycosyltransferase [Kushneria indalinina]REC94289.1 N-acetylglucosaminyldiphosphoundecaprenol N-acetyl-beta-D-mannosaminyltransferase [Kushneria indalinina DSM 14324]
MIFDVLEKKLLSQEIRWDGVATFLNPYTYLYARKNPDIYDDLDYIYCDGFVLCSVFSFLLGRKISRVSFDFTSIAGLFFKMAEDDKKTIAIVGSDKGSISRFEEFLAREYPNAEVVLIRDGFFSSEEEKKLFIKDVCLARADYLLVGMGRGLQEEMLQKYKSNKLDACGFSCGGFLHQTASASGAYYPKFIDKLSLRWVYRIYDEPRLFIRYFFIYPMSLFLMFFDYTVYRLKRK